MEVEIETVPSDYSSFFRYFFFTRNIARKILIVLLLSYFFAAFGDDPRQKLWSFMIPKTLLISLAVFPFYFFVPYFYTLYKFKKAYMSDKSPLGNKKFITTDDGLTVKTGSETIFWKWETIRIIGENQKYIFLMLFNYKLYLIPKRFFLENQEENFLGTVENGIIKVRGNPKPSSPVSLYWWGLLCLIPGIGAMAGFVLLLRGIVEFKDRILILIGASGILISIYFYAALIQENKNTDFDKVFRTLSQHRLNSLMKEIEFYKIQNGVYPENLEQVAKKDSTISLNDPLMSGNDKSKNKIYNYKKLGDKYALFSSGVDGNPNTTDDLYPLIATSDSSKFGLLKR